MDRGGQKLAGMLVNISDIDALGLKTAQGLMLTEPWYWDAERGQPSFAKTFAAAHGGRQPDHDPCRRLRRGDALPQGGCRGRRCRRWQSGGYEDEGHADGRRIVRQGQHSSRWPQASRHVSVRGEAAQRSCGTPGTTTSCARRSRPRRRSGPSVKAAVRWSAADAARASKTNQRDPRAATQVGPAFPRRTGHVTQALARHLRRKNSVRDQSGRARLGARNARARHAALRGAAGVSLLRADADLCRHRSAVAPIRRLSARQARGKKG